MPANAARDLVEWDSDSTPQDMFDDVVGDGEQHLEDFIKRDPFVPPIQDDRPINEYFLLRDALRHP
jgi:hypothetical protein